MINNFIDSELRILVTRIKYYSDRFGNISLDEDAVEKLFQKAKKTSMVEELLMFIRNLYEIIACQEGCNKEMEKKIQKYEPEYKRMIVACKEDQMKIFLSEKPK